MPHVTTLARLAADEPERWNFLLDSFAAGMEPGEQGSVCQVLTASTARWGTDRGWPARREAAAPASFGIPECKSASLY